MSPVAELPPDQRAVVALVLRQGRTYDDLAGLLRIDPDAVRTRAHAAIDALGPETGRRLSAERRAAIADYLLGQQSNAEREATAEQLAGSAAERAWARVVAGELAAASPDFPLPEIPAGGGRRRDGDGHGGAGPPPARDAAAENRWPTGDGGAGRAGPTDAARRVARLPSSKLGGWLLLAAVAILIAVLVVVLLNTGGGGGSSSVAGSSAPAGTSGQGASSQPGATTPSSQNVVAQVNLVPPGGGSSAKGLGLIARQTIKGKQVLVLELAAKTLAQTTGRTYYSVWLEGNGRPPSFVGATQVGKSGQLVTVGQLPANTRSYSRMLVTRQQIQGRTPPKTPGTTVLSGPITFAPGK